MKSPSEVKIDVPFLEKFSYWESTAVGPPLRSVIAALVDHAESYPFNYLVGDCEPALFANRRVEQSVEALAELINAAPSEISLYPKNTTEAIGMVLEGLPWTEGDEIIASDLDHMSCYIPLLRLRRLKGVQPIILKADDEGMLAIEEIKASITHRTRLITICHASNLFGSIQLAKEICSLAQEHGILTLLDAAQTVGRMTVDVREIGCDFLTICGRKHLCGPQGTAALYVRKELIAKLEPVIVGGISSFVSGDLSYDYHSGTRRFNAGILNTSGVVGLGAALQYWSAIGMDTIRSHNASLTNRLQEGLTGMGAVLYGPREHDRQIGVISFRFNNLHPDVLASRLEREAKTIIRSGQPGSPVFKELGVDKVNRLAPHYYHTQEDVDHLLGAVRSMRM